jgi:hypothetical protein
MHDDLSIKRVLPRLETLEAEVAALRRENQQLRQKNQQLRDEIARLKKNSSNSSKPHSAFSLPRFSPAILAVRGRRTHGAWPMGRTETRTRMHYHIGMRRGQKGGPKAPIGVQFRQKSEKSRKKRPIPPYPS